MVGSGTVFVGDGVEVEFGVGDCVAVGLDSGVGVGSGVGPPLGVVKNSQAAMAITKITKTKPIIEKRKFWLDWTINSS